MAATTDRSVREYLHEQLEIVPTEASSLDVAARMRERRVGAVFVESLDRSHQSCRLSGIVTETDLVAKVVGLGRAAGTTRADQIMSHPLVTIAADRPMMDAVQVMDAKHVRHLAVTAGTDIVGVLSVRDVARYFTDTSSGAVQALNDVYHPLTVLMSTAVETLDSQKTVADAARWMASQHIGSLFVVEAGELVGIVTETDVVRKTLARQHDPAAMHLRDLLSFPLVGIDVTRSIRDACDTMASHHIRHLAVTDRTKIVGIVSIRDLVKMVAVRDRPEYLRRTQGAAQ